MISNKNAIWIFGTITVSIFVFSIAPKVFNYDSTLELFMGLTILDVTLIGFCPWASALGLAVAEEMKKIDTNKQNHSGKNPLLISLALGLVVALYFVGSIKSEMSSVAKILALCILLGYQSPNFWSSQEKVLKKMIDEKMEEISKAKDS